MIDAWTNFIKGLVEFCVMASPYTHADPDLILSIEPTLGPRIHNWPKYSPSNSSTLAILGIDGDGAILGDHFETDKVCQYWNEILPIYPQVRVISVFHSLPLWLGLDCNRAWMTVVSS